MAETREFGQKTYPDIYMGEVSGSRAEVTGWAPLA